MSDGRRRALRPGLARLAPSALAFAPRSPRAAGARAKKKILERCRLAAQICKKNKKPRPEGVCLAPGGRGGQSSPGQLCPHPKP